MDENTILKKIESHQRTHLTGLEKWAQQQPLASGVPVVAALNYELIQYLNRVYLRWLLETEALQDG